MGGKETNPNGFMTKANEARISGQTVGVCKRFIVRFGIWLESHNGHAHCTNHPSESDKEMRRGIPE